MIDLSVTQVVMWSVAAVQEGTGVLGAPSGGGTPGAAPAGGGAGTPAPVGGGGLGLMMPILAVMMVFLVFTTFTSGRKEKKRRAEMMASIGKRDRVQTVGGMIGSIVEIKGDEFLLETDRGTNSRAWIAKSAVSAVIKSANSMGDTADLTNEANGATAKA